jgi:hypothetical protein
MHPTVFLSELLLLLAFAALVVGGLLSTSWRSVPLVLGIVLGLAAGWSYTNDSLRKMASGCYAGGPGPIQPVCY